MDELVERCFLALMNDRKLGLPMLDHYRRYILKQRIAAIIPIVQADQRERDAGIALSVATCEGVGERGFERIIGQDIAAAIRKGDA